MNVDGEFVRKLVGSAGPKWNWVRRMLGQLKGRNDGYKKPLGDFDFSRLQKPKMSKWLNDFKNRIEPEDPFKGMTSQQIKDELRTLRGEPQYIGSKNTPRAFNTMEKIKAEVLRLRSEKAGSGKYRGGMEKGIEVVKHPKAKIMKLVKEYLKKMNTEFLTLIDVNDEVYKRTDLSDAEKAEVMKGVQKRAMSTIGEEDTESDEASEEGSGKPKRGKKRGGRTIPDELNESNKQQLTEIADNLHNLGINPDNEAEVREAIRTNIGELYEEEIAYVRKEIRRMRIRDATGIAFLPAGTSTRRIERLGDRMTMPSGTAAPVSSFSSIGFR